MRKRSLLFISFIILLTLLSSGCRSDSAVPESSSVPAKDSAIQTSPPTSVPDSAPAGISFQSGARFSGNETDVALIINADEFFLLDLFPSLSSVDFSGSTFMSRSFHSRKSIPASRFIIRFRSEIRWSAMKIKPYLCLYYRIPLLFSIFRISAH